MERAPLPPHERPWRHPSELGRADSDVGVAPHHRVALLVTGTVAVAMVAALVVSMTPHPAAGPSAVSATTAPATADADGESVREVTVRSARISSFPAIPNAVAAAPLLGSQLRDSGQQQPTVLPDLDDRVVVVTDHVAYAVPWRDVAWLGVDGDAIVVDADGVVVARIDSGRLIVTADALVGAAVSLADD